MTLPLDEKHCFRKSLYRFLSFLDSLIFLEVKFCTIKPLEVKRMAKKGTKYKCEECGLVVVVDNPCACAPCDLICCDVPMKEVKEEKGKAKK
jgi:hypothetical protein